MTKDELFIKIDKSKFKFMEEEKKQYLKDLSKTSTIKTIARALSIINSIDKVEVNHDRPWHLFTVGMVEDSLVGWRVQSRNSFASKLCTVKDYLVKTTPRTDIMLRGYIYTLKFKKSDIDTEDFTYTYRAAIDLKYITREELDYIVLNIKGSPSTRAMMLLLFDGIKGDKYSTLVSIKSSNVDIDNKVIHLCDGTDYIIQDKYIPLFTEALGETEFKGYYWDGTLTHRIKFASDSPYLFKRYGSKGNSSKKLEPIDNNIITNRVKIIGKASFHPTVNPTSIHNSGLTLRLLEDVEFREPSYTEIEAFRAKHNVKLSYYSIREITPVLLAKLNGEIEQTFNKENKIGD